MTNDNKSRRRTDAVSGFVNFPVNDPNLPSDGQGGMFVRLVVVDEKAKTDFYSRWMCCCGGEQNFHMDECYIRDDVSLTKPERDIEPEINDDGSYNQILDDLTNQSLHFPWMANQGEKHQYESIGYLCIMTIGSTGWSNTEWTCTYSDLTDKGKRLYNLLQELYPGGQLYLQTWLDT